MVLFMHGFYNKGPIYLKPETVEMFFCNFYVRMEFTLKQQLVLGQHR